MPELRPEAVDMNVAVLLETVQGEKRVGQGIDCAGLYTDTE